MTFPGYRFLPCCHYFNARTSRLRSFGPWMPGLPFFGPALQMLLKLLLRVLGRQWPDFRTRKEIRGWQVLFAHSQNNAKASGFCNSNLTKDKNNYHKNQWEMIKCTRFGPSISTYNLLGEPVVKKLTINPKVTKFGTIVQKIINLLYNNQFNSKHFNLVSLTLNF